MGCFGCWGFCRCFSCGLFFLPGNEFFWCWVQAGIACFWFSRVFESLVSERVIDPQLLQLCLLWKWFWKGSSFLWVGCTRLVVVGEGEEEKQEAASQMALILEKVKIVRNGDGKIVSCFCFLILRPNAETISSAPFFSCSCSCSSVQQQNTKTSRWWSQMLQRHFLSLSNLEEQQFFYHNSSSEWILPNFIIHHQQFAWSRGLNFCIYYLCGD